MKSPLNQSKLDILVKIIHFKISEILYVQLNSEIHRYNVGAFFPLW